MICIPSLFKLAKRGRKKRKNERKANKHETNITSTHLVFTSVLDLKSRRSEKCTEKMDVMLEDRDKDEIIKSPNLQYHFHLLKNLSECEERSILLPRF